MGEAGTSRQTGRDYQWRHWSLETPGGPLALRRKEVAEIARRLVVVNEVLDNHDGELEPTLGNRRTLAVGNDPVRWGASRRQSVRRSAVGTQHRSRAAGQWRLTISLRCKPIECREYDSVWIVGNSSPIRFDHDCRVISDRTVMTRFQRFAIGVVPDAALSSDFWRPVLRPHTSPVVPFTSVAATSYGYSGNSICRYSFQIPNLQ